MDFTICFISYSVACFLKSRSKQFGLITILGASKKQLNKLIFLENMVVGFISIITGIILGLVFSKFFLDIANKVIGVTDFTFYFPIQAIVVTVIALGLVFLSIAFFTPKLIRKKEVVRLLKTEVTGEEASEVTALPYYLFHLSGLVDRCFCRQNTDGERHTGQALLTSVCHAFYGCSSGHICCLHMECA